MQNIREVFHDMHINTKLALTIDDQYIELLKMLAEQPATVDRTGVGRHKLAGCSLQVDYVGQLAPVLLSKKVNADAFIKETLWFLRGETNVNQLGAKFWDSWANEDGSLGPIYGKQWRNWTDTKVLFTGDHDADCDQRARAAALSHARGGCGLCRRQADTQPRNLRGQHRERLSACGYGNAAVLP